MKQCVSCKTHNVFTKGVYRAFETFACYCVLYHVHWAQELTIADLQQTTRRNDPPRACKDPGTISSSWNVETLGFSTKSHGPTGSLVIERDFFTLPRRNLLKKHENISAVLENTRDRRKLSGKIEGSDTLILISIFSHTSITYQCKNCPI